MRVLVSVTILRGHIHYLHNRLPLPACMYIASGGRGFDCLIDWGVAWIAPPRILHIAAVTASLPRRDQDGHLSGASTKRATSGVGQR